MANNRSEDSRLPHWLAWLAGAVTLLAAAMLLLAVVLGVRAGQQQLEIQTRQQVGIHLQRAIDLRTEGNLPGSLAEYQQVLVLDPTNAGAIQGIENLLQIASSGQSSGIQPVNPSQALSVSNLVESPLSAPDAQPVAAASVVSAPASVGGISGGIGGGIGSDSLADGPCKTNQQPGRCTLGKGPGALCCRRLAGGCRHLARTGGG